MPCLPGLKKVSTESGQSQIGVQTLEDKIVQGAVAEVLSAIYEADFLGFSYGFRPSRSPHEALQARRTALVRRPVNWVLDADILSFFDSPSYSPRAHEGPSKRPSCGFNTLIRKPFRLPRQR